MKPSRKPQDHEWLDLVQRSGPFLTVPALKAVFPTGLPNVPTPVRAAVRTSVEQLMDDHGASRLDVVDVVLQTALGWNNAYEASPPAALRTVVAEHGHAGVMPSYAFRPAVEEVVDDEDAPEDDEDTAPSAVAADIGERRLLGLVIRWGTHPLTRTAEDGWPASGVERIAVALRAQQVSIGLVTDGRWWALVSARPGSTTCAGVWDADAWSGEPESFDAFVALVHRRRFLGVPVADRLPAIWESSLGGQEEVTVELGRQVREAVELLVKTWDVLDMRSGRLLLKQVSDDDVYAAAVTVMMRIVFLLFAEERRLLPSDDERYRRAYSVGHLVAQLEEEAENQLVLESRTGAWLRLLATARAVYGGVAHEDLRLPAYGGGLFDPARFPWVEEAYDGEPIAVDDFTVLQMLRAVQYVEIKKERRPLSFRAIDVEQIGYVYEGLLELEVRRATEPVLGMRRTAHWPSLKKGELPAEIHLSELDVPEPLPMLSDWLIKHTPYKPAALKRLLDDKADPERRTALLRACDGRTDVLEQVEPVIVGLRRDAIGRYAVTMDGGVYTAGGTRRATSGAHYTPRQLAEDVVSKTLEALVYSPGPLEIADRNQWKLVPAETILGLKVADIAMGSGAFLVAACRYLADRLVEAWVAAGRDDAPPVVSSAVDAEVDERTLRARRLIAERCLYGVDINPLAVDMAKLSLWLITMDRERPFDFMDDRFVTGDSLLGITHLDQLTTVHLDPVAGRAATANSLFDWGGWVEPALKESADLRREIQEMQTRTIRDAATKSDLLAKAHAKAQKLHILADSLTGVGLATAKRPAKERTGAFLTLSNDLAFALDSEVLMAGDQAPRKRPSVARALADMQAGRPKETDPRNPLHWPLAFPEIFGFAGAGRFDAIVGNPPFLGGSKIRGAAGDDYLAFLQSWEGGGVKGNADLAARFVLRTQSLLGGRGQIGLITTNTLPQGDTRDVGLEQAVGRGLNIRGAWPSRPWPSRSASLEIIAVWGSEAEIQTGGYVWHGNDVVQTVSAERRPGLGSDLEPLTRIAGRPKSLNENSNICFLGSKVDGLGFIMSRSEAAEMENRDPRSAEVIQDYVIGLDLMNRPDQSASRKIINFHVWDLARSSTYPAAISRVADLVKPVRDLNNRAQRRELWWRYAESAPGLYASISELDFVLCLTRVSSALVPARLARGAVFADTVLVFSTDSFADLAILTSSIHSAWALRYTSTLETRIRYAASDVFQTLPRPLATAKLYELGEELDEFRRGLMLRRKWGLTTTYNKVNDPTYFDSAINELRRIHADIDEATLSAYGWLDLSSSELTERRWEAIDSTVGHYQTKTGMRWSLSPSAIAEILDRLLEENHRRASFQSVKAK